MQAIIENMITVNAAATAAPTAAPTATATGGGATGGLLAAGNYLITFTEVNGVGETTVSPESTSLTVGATNIPRVTFPTLKTGNSGRNLYLTAAGGGTGTEVLYASNITTTTYDCSVAAPASTTVPPTASTTGITDTHTWRVRHLITGSVREFHRMIQDIDNWVSGYPMTDANNAANILNSAVPFTMITTAISEAAVLALANLGTLSSSNNAMGVASTKRTWP